MSVPDTDPGAVGPNDELARQRQKRAARRGFRSPELPEAELRVLRNRCLGAIEESGGTFDVRAYLVRNGHSGETIETVLAHLQVAERTHPSAPAPLARIR